MPLFFWRVVRAGVGPWDGYDYGNEDFPRPELSVMRRGDTDFIQPASSEQGLHLFDNQTHVEDILATQPHLTAFLVSHADISDHTDFVCYSMPLYPGHVYMGPRVAMEKTMFDAILSSIHSCPHLISGAGDRKEEDSPHDDPEARPLLRSHMQSLIHWALLFALQSRGSSYSGDQCMDLQYHSRQVVREPEHVRKILLLSPFSVRCWLPDALYLYGDRIVTTKPSFAMILFAFAARMVAKGVSDVVRYRPSMVLEECVVDMETVYQSHLRCEAQARRQIHNSPCRLQAGILHRAASYAMSPSTFTSLDAVIMAMTHSPPSTQTASDEDDSPEREGESESEDD